jgi:Effector Associated Constant Component 1
LRELPSADTLKGTVSATFELELVPPDTADERGVEQQTIDLAEELKAIRGVKVDPVKTEAPDGVKGLDAETIGKLIGSLSPAAGAVTAVVGVLRSWIKRGQGRKIKVCLDGREIELTGASADTERELVELFTKSIERG